MAPRPATPSAAGRPAQSGSAPASTGGGRSFERAARSGGGEGSGRKTFKRRPDAEAGEVDDFSGPPPSPLPPAALPRLEVKPRVSGVVPGGDVAGRSESGGGGMPGGPPTSAGDSGAPGGGASPGGRSAHPASGGPAPGPTVPASSTARRSFEALGPADDDEGEGDEALLARIDPIDFDEDDLDRLAALIEAFKEVNALAAGQLEHSLYLVRFTPNVLEVALEAREHERVSGQLGRLGRLAQAAVGDHLVLRVHPCEQRDARIDPDRNLFIRRERLAAAEREARVASARRAPAILRAIELLDAEIVDVHPN